jgi:hypothetical protein
MDIMRILVMRFDGFIELLSSNSRHAGDHVQDHFFVVGFACVVFKYMDDLYSNFAAPNLILCKKDDTT